MIYIYIIDKLSNYKHTIWTGCPNFTCFRLFLVIAIIHVQYLVFSIHGLENIYIIFT